GMGAVPRQNTFSHSKEAIGEKKRLTLLDNLSRMEQDKLSIFRLDSRTSGCRMTRQPQDVTDAELAVLQALWNNSPATTRELADKLYPGGKAAHFSTVQKLLERLEDKEYVRRERGDGPQVFVPTVSRDELLGRWLETVAEKLCRGSLTPLLTHLVRANRLSTRDYHALRELIDELEP